MNSGFVYRVRCTFDDPAVAAEWVDWLQQVHLAEVIEAGATAAELVHLDAEKPTYEAVYRFRDRAAFARYEAEHAERLRADGLRRFPLEWGLAYSRSTGEIVGIG